MPDTQHAARQVFRFDLYGHLRANIAQIHQDAERIGREIGIPDEWKGRFGISASNSSCPGVLRRDVLAAIEKTSREIVPLAQLGDEIRRVVKSVYGDEYDAACINSAEAGLWVGYETLIAPSVIGRGPPHRAKCIVPYERHVEHHGSYGRPFPGLYKDLFADRGATAGELGLLGRRQENLDIVFVKLAGARYDVHGVKSYPCPLLSNVDPEASTIALDRAAAIHASELSGFASLAYDTAGYGYGARDADGTSSLHRGIGQLASKYGVPYIADNAWGMPFLGTDIRRVGADIMIYSMDKVAGGPTAGLVIGRAAAMINVRRALGIHSERFGTVSAHGKGSHVAVDPGKEALAGTLAALRNLRDRPESVLRPIDETYAIVLEEFERHRGGLKPGVSIAKSVNAGGVEINYEATWSDDRIGIPIFTHEDRIAQTNLINGALTRMGVIPNLADDANILITPGAGTVGEDGAIIEDRMRLAVRAVFRALRLIQDWADGAVAVDRP